MGTSVSSVPLDYRERHWSRDMQKLFTSTKITDPLDFSADFVIPIFLSSESEKPPIYSFVSKDGNFTALSHVLPDISYKAKLEANIISISEFSANSFLAASDNGCVYHVKCCADKFDFTEIKILDGTNSDLQLTITTKFDDQSFLVALKDGSVFFVNLVEKSVLKLFDLPTPSLPLTLNLHFGHGFPVILVTTEIGLFVCKTDSSAEILSNKTSSNNSYSPIFYQNLTNIIHIAFINSQMYYNSSDGQKIFVSQLNPDLTLTDPKDVYSNPHQKVVDIQQISSTTIVFCGNKDIHSITPENTIRPQLHAILPNDKVILRILKLREPQIFVAICQDGSVCVCRHPEFVRADQKKGEIETAVLFNYHRCTIGLACTAEDFSFLTFDENHVAILWESFPDWWSAPYYLQMFAEPADTAAP